VIASERGRLLLPATSFIDRSSASELNHAAARSPRQAAFNKRLRAL